MKDPFHDLFLLTYKVTGQSRSLLSHLPQVTVVNLNLLMAAEWSAVQAIRWHSASSALREGIAGSPQMGHAEKNDSGCCTGWSN